MTPDHGRWPATCICSVSRPTRTTRPRGRDLAACITSSASTGAHQRTTPAARRALNRALELNPDLSIADRFYAQLEVGDLGRAQEAMVRLVRRASSRGSDPELFAALVPACRYCGLLRHSLAAYERASAPRSEHQDKRAAHVLHARRLPARRGRSRTDVGAGKHRGACRWRARGTRMPSAWRDRVGAVREYAVSSTRCWS